MRTEEVIGQHLTGGEPSRPLRRQERPRQIVMERSRCQINKLPRIHSEFSVRHRPNSFNPSGTD